MWQKITAEISCSTASKVNLLSFYSYGAVIIESRCDLCGPCRNGRATRKAQHSSCKVGGP